MEAIHVLRDLLIVFAVAGGVVFLLHGWRVPSVVGLLVAGIVVGPYGLSLIKDLEQVEMLAEVGVVVLLFAVGLEFSIPKLVGMGRLMATIGLPQVLLCVLIGVTATGWYFGDVRPAIFAGILLAMSSTAVVFKLLGDRGELTTPQGNVSVAVLLFQDLLVVVCMVLLPLLSHRSNQETSLWFSLGLGSVVVVLLLFVGRVIVPQILFLVVRTKNRELFLMLLILLCLGSAFLTASMGWSLAMGAFLAGLMLSESEYATQTLAEVLPFRDTLASLFFVSVGMLLDLRFLFANLPLVLLTVIAVIVGKFLAGALPTLLSGYPLRIAVLAGVALAQIGEFSFILADRGAALQLLNRNQYQTFLAAAVLTVALTPVLIAAGPRIASVLEGIAFLKRWQKGGADDSQSEVDLNGHVIVVGYGVNGRNLARVLRAVDVDYVILELNPETVRLGLKHREPIFYGDSTRPAVLKHLGIESARVFVIGISDPASTRQSVQLARGLNPDLQIIVRTRYLAEVAQLRGLGANVIIPEEFETSVEIFAQVLREYEVPRNLIDELIDRVRGDHYEVLRDANTSPVRVVLPYAHILESMEIKSYWLSDGAAAIGQSVGDLRIRRVTGATLLAVRRGTELIQNPGADFRFQLGDFAILIGDETQVDRAFALLRDGKLRSAAI